MKSQLTEPVMREVEMVVVVEEVESPAGVRLDLSIPEFLSLWGLHYIKANGNPKGGLRYRMERGLDAAFIALRREYPATVDGFRKSLQFNRTSGDSAYDRIADALAAVGYEVSDDDA